MSSNSVFNRTTAKRESVFVNYSDDYRAVLLPLLIFSYFVLFIIVSLHRLIVL